MIIIVISKTQRLSDEGLKKHIELYNSVKDKRTKGNAFQFISV